MLQFCVKIIAFLTVFLADNGEMKKSFKKLIEIKIN